MPTLAKSKAQALVQPAKPLAVTPNVRQFNSPAAGAALLLSSESTNLVQVVNPASTLTINVDGQNFSAFGANHFVLHVDTTAATEISLNFVRGATILATKVIEIDADQIAVLTFAAITKANDAVSLLAIGHHVVGKSEATDGNGAVGGLRFMPTGAVETVDGDYQQFTYDGAHTVSVLNDGNNYLIPVWHADLPEQHRNAAYQITIKMPQGAADLFIANAVFDDVFIAERNFNHIALELRSEDMQGVPSSGLNVNIEADQANSTSASIDPLPAGSLIILNISDTSIQYSSPNGSGSLAIPTGFFSSPANVIAYAMADQSGENVPALSIKVVGA